MKQTLKDLQNVLPIGLFAPDGTLHKQFTHKPWRMEEERMVGKIRETGDYQFICPFISEVLGAMTISIGGMSFQDKNQAQRRLMVSQMFISDVMYMYVWLRREALGADVSLQSTCPMCGNKSKIVISLDELEVDSNDQEVKSPMDLHRTIILKKGIIVSGTTHEEITIRPSTWMAMEGSTVKSLSNDGAVKTNILRDSIVGVTGLQRDHFIATDDILDSLYKVDIELIAKAINDMNGGLNMSVETKCENCNRKYEQGVDWNYDNFFSHSSIP